MSFSALTPLRFLTWAGDVYPERLAVVHGQRQYTWKQTRKRAERLALRPPARMSEDSAA